MTDKYKACYGYGYWAIGDFCPMGPMDAGDGIPTLECPVCHSNANPIKKNGRVIKTKEDYKKYM